MFLFGLAGLPAQRLADQPSQLVGQSPALARVLAAATAAAARTRPPVAGRALAMQVLVALRSGALGRSADLLAKVETAPADAETAAWLAAAHLWHARATGTPVVTDAQWQALATSLTSLPDEPDPVFETAAMHVHGLFCLGALGEWRDHGPQGRDHGRGGRRGTGTAWTQQAIERQVALERRSWQPGLGCFRAVVTHGALAVPAAAEPSTLRPASAGLLLATGDRLPRHLATTLAHWEQAAAPRTVTDVALALGTATQLLDDGARARAWAALLAMADGPLTDDEAGLVLDALLFALTGVRLATGAGLDETWQRGAPWLPPDHDHLTVRGLVAGGACYDVVLEARHGPRRSDEADPSAHLAGDGPRLHVQWHLRQSHDAAPRTIVLAGPGHQTMQWLAPGDTFTCSLPRREAHAQDDPHRFDDRLRGLAPDGRVRTGDR